MDVICDTRTERKMSVKHPNLPIDNVKTDANAVQKNQCIEQKTPETKHCAEFLKEFIMPIRQSYGIILIRENDGLYQALLTQRRNTYAYDSFVLGKYSMKNDKNRVKKMFDEMSADELTDIFTLDFKKMWWRFCLKEEPNNIFYTKKNGKFNASFMSDGGKTLKNMLSAAEPCGKPVYEYPKGRKNNPDELNLVAAIREFKEETNIDQDGNYVFLDDKIRWNTHVSDGVKYKNMYYAAFLKNENIKISLSLGRFKQLSEVKSVQWMDINEIRKVDFPDNRLELLVQPVFNLVKRRIHGRVRYLESKSDRSNTAYS